MIKNLIQTANRKLSNFGGKANRIPDYDEIEEKIIRLGSELEDIKYDILNKKSKDGKFCGKAFVIFNSQVEADRIGI